MFTILVKITWWSHLLYISWILLLTLLTLFLSFISLSWRWPGREEYFQRWMGRQRRDFHCWEKEISRSSSTFELGISSFQGDVQFWFPWKRPTRNTTSWKEGQNVPELSVDHLPTRKRRRSEKWVSKRRKHRYNKSIYIKEQFKSLNICSTKRLY